MSANLDDQTSICAMLFRGCKLALLMLDEHQMSFTNSAGLFKLMKRLNAIQIAVLRAEDAKMTCAPMEDLL
jgi:hypothetical protein